MLPDYLAPGLSAVFVGTSVAKKSATKGHYYSGPRNRFWQLLRETGLTGGRLFLPNEDSLVLGFGIGLTDLVKKRAASSDSHLRGSDYDVPGFLAKVRQFHPFAVVFNGKEPARRIRRDPELGVAPFCIERARVYVLPSSSGSSADPMHFAPLESKGHGGESSAPGSGDKADSLERMPHDWGRLR